MKNPLELGCRCAECPFAVNGVANKPVWGTGNMTSPVGVVVSECPTQEDAVAGRPFVGQVGVALGEVLSANKLPRESLFLVHAILCKPSLAAYKEPKLFKQAMECCRPALVQQLQQLPPLTPTLSCGKWAQRSLMGRQLNLSKTRGFIRWGWHGIAEDL